MRAKQLIFLIFFFPRPVIVAGACGAGRPLAEAFAGRSPGPAMEAGGAGKPGGIAF